MKRLSLLLIPFFLQAPVFAGDYFSRGQRNTYEVCTRYKEIYQPGYYDSNGNYRRGSVKTIKENVPCGYSSYPRHRDRHYHSDSDNNSCIEGSILGGILGGGAGAALSRQDGRLWAVPLGIVGGALVGCQVDGG